MVTTKKFDIYEFLEGRAMSWSMMSSFEWDPEQWYQSYILGIRQTSKEMDFGSYVDKKIQSDPTFLPGLPRYEQMQYKMKAVYAGKIPLVGIPDGLNLKDKKELWDYKTGKAAWTKKRADDTGQLTFYLLLLFICHKHKPEEFECGIHWLPTREMGDFSIGFVENIDENIKSFRTKRTMADLLEFCRRIEKTVKAMEDYVNNKK